MVILKVEFENVQLALDTTVADEVFNEHREGEEKLLLL